MEEKDLGETNVQLQYESDQQVPFPFRVVITKGEDKDRFLYQFQVSDATSKHRNYELQNDEHKSYLDLFLKLATDFGLRTPQNRRKNTTTPNFKVSYKELLTRNIDDRIWYGYGDPAVIKVNNSGIESYYLVCTSNDAPDSFPVLKSDDLRDWQLVDFIFPAGRKPEWVLDGIHISDFWAPEMHKVGNEFRVYFVAREKATGDLSIGLARASSPEGPFTADPEPILRRNVIDPHVYVDENQKSWLYWKEDNNGIWPDKLISFLFQQPQMIREFFDNESDQKTASFLTTLWPWIEGLEPMDRFLATQVLIEAVTEHYYQFYQKIANRRDQQPVNNRKQLDEILKFMKTPMYAQELTENGSSLVGEKVKIIENDLEWEAHLVEGMWVTKFNNYFYLFYAGNDFSTDQYGIGVAIGESPLGPFTKIEKQLLQSTEKWWAPGHPSVVMDKSGKPLMILHAYLPHAAGYKEFRALLGISLKLDGLDVGFHE